MESTKKQLLITFVGDSKAGKSTLIRSLMYKLSGKTDQTKFNDILNKSALQRDEHNMHTFYDAVYHVDNLCIIDMPG